jgi:hypothetical protein
LVQSLEEVAAPADFTGILLPLGTLMFSIQEFLKKQQFEFFHPDDLRYIARKVDGDRELVVRIQASFVPGGQRMEGGDGELDCEVVGIVGSTSDFDDFVERFSEMLTESSPP